MTRNGISFPWITKRGGNTSSLANITGIIVTWSVFLNIGTQLNHNHFIHCTRHVFTSLVQVHRRSGLQQFFLNYISCIRIMMLNKFWQFCKVRCKSISIAGPVPDLFFFSGSIQFGFGLLSRSQTFDEFSSRSHVIKWKWCKSERRKCRIRSYTA